MYKIFFLSLGLFFVICMIMGGSTAYHFVKHFSDEWEKEGWDATSGMSHADYALAAAKEHWLMLSKFVHRDRVPQLKVTHALSGRDGSFPASGESGVSSAALLVPPSFVYDRNGTYIGQFRDRIHRFVSPNTVSPHFLKALIFSEDMNFFVHDGINIRGIIRAAYRVLVRGEQQGGSSITMQVAKMLLDHLALDRWEKASPGQAREEADIRTLRPRGFHGNVLGPGIRSKFEELFFSQILERTFDKQGILLLYYNLVHFGMQNDGVEQAAYFYFGVSSASLTLTQSAFLVGLMPNPTRFNPLKWAKYTDAEDNLSRQFAVIHEKAIPRARARHRRVLSLLSQSPEFRGKSDGWDNEKWLDETLQQFWEHWSIVWSKYNPNRQLQATEEWIAEEGMEYIFPVLLKELKDAGFTLYNVCRESLRIDTTIDIRAQRNAQKHTTERIKWYREVLGSLRKYRKSVKRTEGALITLDNKSGEIIALVGGAGYGKSLALTSGQTIRATQAYRQPGSSFKPILYLAAMEQKPAIHPLVLVPDEANVRVLSPDGTEWKVGNSNGKGYGPIYLYQALKISSNTAAALYSDWLYRAGGMDRVQRILKDGLGLDDKEVSKRFPKGHLSVALGSEVVTPFEMARLYAMIANGGSRVDGHMLRSIRGQQGEIVYQHLPQKQVHVIDSCLAYHMRMMLQTVTTKGGTGYPIRHNYDEMYPAGGKTGTSNEARDAWFCGFNSSLTTVIWMGNDQNDPLRYGGSVVSAPLWGTYMGALLEDGVLDKEELAQPADQKPSMCRLKKCCRCPSRDVSGNCRHRRVCFFIPDDVPCVPQGQAGILPLFGDGDSMPVEENYYTVSSDDASAFEGSHSVWMVGEDGAIYSPDEVVDDMFPDIMATDSPPPLPLAPAEAPMSDDGADIIQWVDRPGYAAGPEDEDAMIQIEEGSPGVIEDGGSVQPGVVEDGGSVQPGIVEDGGSVQPGIVEDGGSVQPGVIEDGGSVQPGIVEDGGSVQPGIVEDGGSVQPGIVEDGAG